MVKIHECQYVLNNISNRQERDIGHHSWNKYVDDILDSPRRQDLADPSLPMWLHYYQLKTIGKE